METEHLLCKDNECPCQVVNPEMCQVLGRDVLRADILNDMQLYLECDDDQVYEVPMMPESETSTKNVRIRVTFPTHPVSVESKRFRCDKCDFSAKREVLLLEHIARCHDEQNLFSCEQCDYKGQRHHHLYKHMLRVHDIRISSKIKITEGSNRNEGNRSYVQEQRCLKSDTLLLHEKSTLEAVKGKDTDCLKVVLNQVAKGDKSDTTMSNLIQDDTGSKINCDSKTKKKLGPTNERVKCNECEHTFLSQKNLREHCLRLHNSNRVIYRCDKCQQSFKRKLSLEAHKRRHDGLLEYKCEICEKGFASRGSLKAHKGVHELKRPYACKQCDKTYKTRNALNEHYKKKHRDSDRV